ncbi:unnamed protein product [Rotaria sordida]|uniref:EGF-like domain-containing protein n=1 Tax=Rotaria sordida TaxID=392033 RepID=A0A813PFI8_9BILA|nr:unnamed protein product [Rotaria sordida]CAF0817369.1 unnamed protein product [Rotaria sordida]CAF3488473.1 unnamed protein product [Rotaria sordida]CAF3673960.1 unnamed protein product [Rotaria sordida]
MTTHATTPLDIRHPPHHTLYSNRTYARTTTTTAATRSSIVNRPFHSCLKKFPPINICENLLYDVAIAGDIGSATSSSYINSNEHYDNTFTNTYDNPIQYFENYPSKSIDIVQKSLTDLPHSNENFYDHAKDEHDDENCSTTTARSTSPVLFYLENKNLAICACIISLLLLLLIGLGIFLLNKLIRPVIINTTVNNHYGIMNMSNTTTTTTTITTTTPITTTTLISSRSTISKPFVMLLRRSSIDILTTTTSTLIKDNFDLPCPPNRWGRICQYMCKPCGLGVCHQTTGNCICPEDMYGEFCDLWKVNDKPKRGDMMS